MRLRTLLSLPTLVTASAVISLGTSGAIVRYRTADALERSRLTLALRSATSGLDNAVIATQAYLEAASLVSELEARVASIGRSDHVTLRRLAWVERVRIVRASDTAVADRQLYAAVGAAGGPAVGAVHRVRDSWTLDVGYPVRRGTAPPRVLAAGILLDSLPAFHQVERLAPQSVVSIQKRDGRIVYRSSDAIGWIGRRLPVDTGMWNHPERNERIDTLVRGPSLDGVRRLIGTSRSTVGPWLVYVGIPWSSSLASVRARLWRDVALTLAITLATLLLGGAVARHVTRALDALRAVIDARTTGDVTPPVIVQGPREIRVVSAAFTELVSTLNAREAELTATSRRLAEAQRLETVGRFSASLAHDINNLLHTISAQADLLGMAMHANQNVLDDCQAIVRATQRAAMLTRRVLITSRGSPERAKAVDPIDLTRTVAGLSTTLTMLVRPRCTLAVYLPQTVLPVRLEGMDVEQILLNLVANARDASPPGEQIDLRLAPPTDEEPTMVRLSVVNSGDPIPAEVRDRMFDPFFTTKATGKGTGLGLAIVQEIVRRAQGRITVESEAGRTVFAIDLPISDEEPLAPHDAVEAPDLDGCRILVVDNDSDARQATAALLAARGALVTATSPEDSAVDACLAPGATLPDLVLADIILDGTTGPAVVRRVRRVQPTVRALYLSGIADDNAWRTAGVQPTDLVLAKPATAVMLATAVSLIWQPSG